jgi:hypothetical protein
VERERDFRDIEVDNDVPGPFEFGEPWRSRRWCRCRLDRACETSWGMARQMGKKAWPIWLAMILLALIEATSKWVRQSGLEVIHRMPAPRMVRSTVRTSRRLSWRIVASRACAWVAFFVGVLLSGFAVVIRPDDKDQRTAGYWTKLCTKHRNVVILIVSALFWATAYAGFVRVALPPRPRSC